MATIANIATFPARKAICADAIDSIAVQVDQVNIVLNGYSFVPGELKRIPKANFIFPPRDLKDVGKFFPAVDPDDDVFMVDDDILYPGNYVETMKSIRERLADIDPILGLHGLTYSDYYEGKHGSGRLVYVFTRALEKPQLVNQLGTGTVYCKGYQVPSFEFMEGSEQFVDIRFARHSYANGYPNICVARPEQWLQQLETTHSIFESFTKSKPLHVVREVQDISGFRKMNPAIWAVLADRFDAG